MIVNGGLPAMGEERGPAFPSPGARAVNDLPPSGEVLTTRTGLHMPPDLEFGDWEKAGRQLAGVVDSSCWWLGDWLVYGKENYADRYQRGINAAGLKYQTLRNYAWVARRFPLTRRRARLTFQHHAEVASLPVEQQERLLGLAEELKWTTKQLRNAIRENLGAVAAEESVPAPVRRLAVSGSRVQLWRRAAEQSGIEFDIWVQMTLDRAAGQILEDDVELPALSA